MDRGKEGAGRVLGNGRVNIKYGCSTLANSIFPGLIHFVNGSLINNIDAGLLVPVRNI